MSRLRRAFSNLPIRVKLFCGSAVAALLVMAAGSLVLYLVLRASIDRDIEHQLATHTTAILDLVRTSASTAIRSHLRAVAEKNRDMVAHFHALAESGRLSQEEAKAWATEVLLSQTIGATGYIFCIDSHGIIQVHPREEMQHTDLKRYPFIQVQIQRKQGYVEYEWANPGEKTPRAKALYMTYFAPWDWIISASSYRDEFHNLVQVKDFRKAVLASTFGETGYSYVMDDKGTLIIHPKLEGANIADSTDSSGRKFIQEILQRRNGTIVYPWQNPGEDRPREKLVVFNSIPELGWIVASSSYLEEFQRPLRLLAYVTVGMAVGVVLMLFPLTWWIGGVLTKPLAPLMESLAAGAQGDLSQRMDEALAGEFGRLAAYYNHFMDRLEESLRRLAESEGNYRAIVENAAEGIFQSLTGGAMLSANPAMAAIFGYAGPQDMLAEVSNLATQIYANPEDRRRLIGLLAGTDRIAGHEIRFRRRDGSIFWGELSGRAVRGEDGDILYMEGMIKDITAQREALETLTRAKEEAEAAGRLKSDFLSLVSHEMRTPLTSVQGFARMVGKQLATKVLPALDPSGKDATRALRRAVENLGVIVAEAERLALLIDDVLDLSQLEFGGQTLSLAPVRPVDLAAHAREATAGPAAAKGLVLDLAVDEGLPAVLANRKRILQVLGNLLDNAVKFTPAGTVTLSAAMRDNTVAFAVADTGPGIPAESLERIFDHFTQLGDVNTGKPQGTGLGLALCRRIVTLHHGRIWAESIPGSGSVFIFTLPTAEQD